jgi:hypothetical protein
MPGSTYTIFSYKIGKDTSLVPAMIPTPDTPQNQPIKPR